jgi:hypothetical protein
MAVWRIDLINVADIWLETSHIEYQKQVRGSFYELCEKLSCYVLNAGLFAWLVLKMEATRSSETSVDFQRYAQRYIKENRNLLI